MSRDGLPFRQRVLAGETVFGTFLGLGSPAVTDVCARAGFDWLLVDLEHGAAGEADLLPLLLAMRGTATTPIVRVEQAARPRLGRVLDLGADGVMVPQVASAAEARDVVSWVRFQPAGRRGIALFTRGLDYGHGGHGAVVPRNEELLTIIQVESQSALDEVDEIAGIDGVDVLFVGPTDLTHALGVPGQIDHADYKAAIARVAAAARSHGKACGVLLWKPGDAVRYAALGYTVLAISSDGSLLERGVRDALAVTRDAVTTANP